MNQLFIFSVISIYSLITSCGDSKIDLSPNMCQDTICNTSQMQLNKPVSSKDSAEKLELIQQISALQIEVEDFQATYQNLFDQYKNYKKELTAQTNIGCHASETLKKIQVIVNGKTMDQRDIITTEGKSSNCNSAINNIKTSQFKPKGDAKNMTIILGNNISISHDGLSLFNANSSAFYDNPEGNGLTIGDIAQLKIVKGGYDFDMRCTGSSKGIFSSKAKYQVAVAEVLRYKLDSVEVKVNDKYTIYKNSAVKGGGGHIFEVGGVLDESQNTFEIKDITKNQYYIDLMLDNNCSK